MSDGKPFTRPDHGDPSLTDGLGFDLPDEAWLRQLRGDLHRHVPERIGRYNIAREIERGGQAVVFLGCDEETGQAVALKRHRAGQLASDAAQARFRREIEVTASLDHPGIVRVLGVESLGAEPVICLEWVDGRPIDRWAAEQRGRATDFPSSILEVFLQVCDAVSHAHHKGVLHRDIKPSNVLVDGAGDAKVLDFGVAGLLADEGDGLTITGEFVGTPVYAAPERLSGDATVPDTRGDVYSLGVLLYEMLTGRLPWRADGRLSETMRRIREEVPEAASRHDRRIRPELEAIAHQALARSADDRYQSVASLADDIRRHREGRPIEAVVRGPWQRTLSFVRRHRIALGATALATAAGIVFGSIFQSRTRELAVQYAAADDHRNNVLQTSAELAVVLRRFDLLTSLSAVRRAIEVANELQRRPAWEHHAPEMRAWLEQRARPLVAQLPQLEDGLAEVVALAPNWNEDRAEKFAAGRASVREAAAEHARQVAEAGPFGRGLAVAWQAYQRIVKRRAQLIANFGERLTNSEDQYIRDVLAGLVTEIDTLRAWCLPIIESRLAWAEVVRQRSIDDHAEAWRSAIESIRASSHYGGLALTPQVGLVPLGENPQSHLWEFAHLRSASDATLPTVDPDGRVRVTEPSGIVFVLVPASMCVPDNRPLPPFFLAKHELTQAQFDRLSPSPNPTELTPAASEHVHSRTHPAERVDCLTARRVLRAQGLRLPRDREWQQACRGGTTGDRYTGEGPDSLQGHANVADRTTARFMNLTGAPWEDGFAVHAPVGSFPPNPFGFHDMFGNVAEISELDGDFHPTTTPASVRTTVVFRGGTWFRGPAECSVEIFVEAHDRATASNIGVRPARSVLP